MNFAQLGAAAGAPLGLLPSAFGALSAPREELFRLLGSPDGSGSALLQALLGVDPNSAGGQYGGVAAEMLLDPLNLAMVPMTGGLGMLAGRAAMAPKLAEAAGLGSQISKLRSLGNAAEAASSTNAARMASEMSALAPRPAASLTYQGVADPEMVARSALGDLSYGYRNNPFMRQTAKAYPGMARGDLAGVRQALLAENATANAADEAAAFSRAYAGFRTPGELMSPRGLAGALDTGIDPFGQPEAVGGAAEALLGQLSGRRAAALAQAQQVDPLLQQLLLGASYGTGIGSVGAAPAIRSQPGPVAPQMRF